MKSTVFSRAITLSAILLVVVAQPASTAERSVRSTSGN